LYLFCAAYLGIVYVWFLLAMLSLVREPARGTQLMAMALACWAAADSFRGKVKR
jgi:hypothetical protein